MLVVINKEIVRITTLKLRTKTYMPVRTSNLFLQIRKTNILALNNGKKKVF